jgi:hypothetical protein
MLQAARRHLLCLLLAQLHASAARRLQRRQGLGQRGRHRSPHQSRHLLRWRVVRRLQVLCW